MLATADNDGSTRLWDVATGWLITGIRGSGNPVGAVAFSQDGDELPVARSVLTWPFLAGQRTPRPSADAIRCS